MIFDLIGPMATSSSVCMMFDVQQRQGRVDGHRSQVVRMHASAAFVSESLWLSALIVSVFAFNLIGARRALGSRHLMSEVCGIKSVDECDVM